MTRALILAACLALVAVLPTTAQRPRTEYATRDAVLWNARAAVGELGWRAPDDAYAAIVEVHIRRASLTGTTPSYMARTYSAAVRRPPRRRAWVRELHGRPQVPPSWPSHLVRAWPRHAQRFVEVREVVRATLEGERDVACPDAEHYGSREDGAPGGRVDRWETACTFEGTTQQWWRRR